MASPSFGGQFGLPQLSGENVASIRAANDAERRMLEAAPSGVWPGFPGSPDDRPVFRAEFLRQLILALSRSHLPWGVNVNGARIEGALNLWDWTGIGGAPLPPLVLEDCDIPETIDVSHARLARFSVKNSRITHIRARGLRIEGPFDFSGVRAYVDPAEGDGDGVAWIDARGARIEGDVNGRGARLRVPPPRPKDEIKPGEKIYALRFSNCLINGRIELFENFRADGGVNFDDGDIRGEVWLSGADVSAGEGDAFRGQSARFGSALCLDDGFKAKGGVWLLGAHIAGALQCTDASLENRTEDGAGAALAASGSRIGGRVSLDGKDFKASGIVDFQYAEIEGGFDCADATFENRTADGNGNALTLESVRIGGDVVLGGEGFKALGCVRLSNIEVKGGLWCNGGTFENQTEDGTGCALIAENSRIGGSAFLSAKLKATGQLRFSHADIKGSMILSDAVFENRNKANFRGQQVTFTLAASNAQIAGDLLLTRTVSVGEISLWGMGIGKDFVAQNATLVGPVFAISAPHLRVGGDLLLNEANVLGSIWFPHIEVGGQLDWTELRLLRERLDETTGFRSVSSNSRLNLANARIGAQVRAKNLAIVPNINLIRDQIVSGLEYLSERSLADPLISELKNVPDVKMNSDWLMSGLTRIEAAIYHRLFPDGRSLDRPPFPDADLISDFSVISDLKVLSTFRLEIDLSGAHASSLDDWWPHGWGGEEAARQGLVSLKLDGFSYDRIESPAEASGLHLAGWFSRMMALSFEQVRLALLAVASWFLSTGRRISTRMPSVAAVLEWCGRETRAAGERIEHDQRRRHSAKPRLAWLRLQDKKNFFPQPYRHLARVLRLHGHGEAAREVGIEEERRTPAEWWYRIPKFFFGLFFGYGLSPLRASFALLFCFLLGWVGTDQALSQKGVMVLTTMPVASVLVRDSGAQQPAIQNAEHSLATIEAPCTDQIVSPFYAIDVMLPAIPLHQETVCDISARHTGWRWAKFLFSVFGKIVTTLALITFSGVLRARSEE